MKDNTWLLKEKQNLPLATKVQMTIDRLQEWYKKHNGKVYVCFSGGKDSTVLLHIARSIYPEIRAVFLNTGLEYPEVYSFVKTIKNVEWLRPNLTFRQVIDIHGYPIINKEIANYIHQVRTTKSSRLRHKRLHGDADGRGKISNRWMYLINAPFKINGYCCKVMKIYPFYKYDTKTKSKPIIGTMAIESSLRTQTYHKYGCNSYDTVHPSSKPLSFWKEVDIWNYIKLHNLPYSTIYNLGFDRTGCMFCMFGLQAQKGKNKFQIMYETHHKLWNYCIKDLGCGNILDYLNVPYTKTSVFY